MDKEKLIDCAEIGLKKLLTGNYERGLKPDFDAIKFVLINLKDDMFVNLDKTRSKVLENEIKFKETKADAIRRQNEIALVLNESTTGEAYAPPQDGVGSLTPGVKRKTMW